MEIGTGIAIAGVWIYAGMIGSSDETTNQGMWLTTGIAVITTGFFLIAF